MSIPRELPHTWDSQNYEAKTMSQHIIQADVPYWLTSESPITKALSMTWNLNGPGSMVDHVTPAALPTASKQNVCSGINPQTAYSTSPSLPLSDHQAHIHLSELENRLTDIPSSLAPSLSPNEQVLVGHPYSVSPFHASSAYMSSDFLDSYYAEGNLSPYSSSSLYDDSPMQSPCLSSPDLYRPQYAARAPRSSPKDGFDQEDEDTTSGRPYARLIYEALLQAPGHQMMLRDIYKWFERHTTKPQESGSNGWQNSIRHNLSMNEAFENDKTQCTNARGETKKATSVWCLTAEALANGVQSTTRFRKKDPEGAAAGRKRPGSRSPDYRRQKSGAKGGRAARRAARLRRLEQSHTNWGSNTFDDVGRFDSLVHVANHLQEYSLEHENNSLTPTDNLPYTPRSPIQGFKFEEYDASRSKMNGMGASADQLIGSELLFQHHCLARDDELW